MNKETKTRLIQVGLLLITIVTTTLAGTEWMYSKYLFFVREDHLMTWKDFVSGFQFSIPFLLILTVHEFGHYFTAKYHKIKVTLPYYIPMWLGFLVSPSFGTMGAFIRIKDKVKSRIQYFDIGVSGPVAGFVIALFVISYGYSNLPEPEHIFDIHPEYEQFGLDYADHVYSYDFSKQRHFDSYQELRFEDSVASVSSGEENWSYPAFEAYDSYPGVYFGKPLLFLIYEKYFVSASDRYKIPNKEEIMHNPYLLAGLLALFFTALNLLPIGQLDGGHVVFGLFGNELSKKISASLYTLFLFYAGLGLISMELMTDTSISGSLNFLFILLAYTYFIYLCAYSMFPNKRDRLTYAAILMAVQFGAHTFFGFKGYEGYLLFALLLGRFVGIYHPPVSDNQSLTPSRVAVGVFALIIFVLSFSPEPFVMGF